MDQSPAIDQLAIAPSVAGAASDQGPFHHGRGPDLARLLSHLAGAAAPDQQLQRRLRLVCRAARLGSQALGQCLSAARPAHLARQLTARLVSDRQRQLSRRRRHRLAARAHQDSLQPYLGISFLGFLHGSRAADDHRLDHFARSRYRHDQRRAEKFIPSRPGAVQYFQRAGNRLGQPDGPRHLDQSHALDAGLPQHGFDARGSRARRRREQFANAFQSHPAADDLADDDGFRPAASARVSIVRDGIPAGHALRLFRLLDQDFHLDQKSDSQLRRSHRSGEPHVADDRLDHSAAALDSRAAPLHHDHRQLSSRPDRSRSNGTTSPSAPSLCCSRC